MAYELSMQPLTIKKITVPNRVVFPPIQTNYATETGEATERLTAFHESIARNRVGLSIVGATGISSTSRLGTHALSLYEDNHVDAARQLFDAIRKTGSVAAVQINHGGRALSRKLAGGELVGPSAIVSPAGRHTPRELATDEVQQIVDQFVHTAESAKIAGADLVEFHAAHSYLLNQFLSPAANHRSDQYGGSTENRARIVLEILKKTRQKVGEDFIIGLRMSVDEYVDGGLTVEESRELIKMFVSASLDVIHVSAGGMDSGPRMLQEALQGNLIKLAGEIKPHIDIPVIAVGGVQKLEQVETALQAGLADMVAIGRGLIADPALVTKSLDGKPETIEECTGCMQCFMPGEDPGMTCSVNESL